MSQRDLIQRRGAPFGGRRTPVLNLDFPGLPGPVRLPDDAGLATQLMRCLTGWLPEPTPPRADGPAPVSWIEPAGPGRYRVTSPFLPEPLDGLSATAAVCATLADMTQAYSAAQPGALGLHCGALELAGRIVVLTGPRRAGKSTLTARMTAEPGVRLFCDDVLPVLADGRALGLGVAPRLRLPLPDTAGPVLRAHVEAHPGPADDRYGYLMLPNLAPHGSLAPLGALVMLDRRASGPARLHRLDPAQALRLLLVQTITDLPSAEAAFDRAESLTDGLPVLRLVYSDLDQAAALLMRAFAGPDLPADLDIGPDLPFDTAIDAAPEAAPVPLDQIWQRSPAVALRQHGQATFLWQAGEPMLWELNPVGTAIWQMLEIPGSAADCAEVLAEVFPDTPPAQLRDDMRRHLAALAEAGLLQPIGAGPLSADGA